MNNLEFFDLKSNARFYLKHDFSDDYSSKKDDLIHILWNQSNEDVDILLDHKKISLRKNEVISLTFLHHFKIINGLLTSYSFNREFYCIKDHDQEVSCNGIIFFGTQEAPIIKLDDSEVRKFNALHQVFLDEFGTKDNIQGEMLRMLLKRLIIKITRLVKKEAIPTEFNDNQIELIRKFNFLVDMHYKEMKSVSEYADMLYRSPKTLSNLFSKYNQKSPSKIIQDRIVLEAKRLLQYTDLSISEIAYELGYREIQPFNKVFKKNYGKSPSEYRIQSGEI